MKLGFSRQIFYLKKTPQTSNFMKIRPVGAKVFQADGQAGMTKPTVAFRDFVNAPKNSTIQLRCSLGNSRQELTHLQFSQLQFLLQKPHVPAVEEKKNASCTAITKTSILQTEKGRGGGLGPNRGGRQLDPFIRLPHLTTLLSVKDSRRKSNKLFMHAKGFYYSLAKRWTDLHV